MVIGIDFDTKIGIYCIENTINNKKYIGSSKDIFKRRNRHFNNLKNNVHPNKKLQSSYNKYKIENFNFYILELLQNEDDLINREQYYMDSLKPHFNINLIANSSLGLRRSKETIEKIRQANLGLKHPEWRNEIKSKSQGGENHWAFGKKIKQSTKDKKSESMTEYFKNNPPLKRVPISEFNLNDEFVRNFSSLKEAGQFYNINPDSISNCLRGKSKTAGNKKWKYNNNKII